MIEQDPTHLRVAVVVPQQGLIISPNFESPHLFSGTSLHGETNESAAHRIVDDERYGLPRMKTVLSLGAVNDIIGYALTPAHPDELNLRQFAVRGYDQADTLEFIANYPGRLDPVDLEFLVRAIIRRQKR